MFEQLENQILKKSLLQLAKKLMDAFLLSFFQGQRNLARITRAKRSETPRRASLRTSAGRPRRFSRVQVRVYAGVVKRVTDAQKCCCKKHVSHPPGPLSYQATRSNWILETLPLRASCAHCWFTSFTSCGDKRFHKKKLMVVYAIF